MNKITETIPDDLPEWAEKAIDEGNFFRIAIDMIKKRDVFIKDNEHLLPFRFKE